MNFKLIITTLIIAFAVAGCSAKENHENTAGTSSSTNKPAATDSADRKDDNIVDDAGDAMKDMADGAGEAMKDAGDGAGNAVKDMAN